MRFLYKENMTELKLKVLETYNKAMVFYKARQWQNAMDEFQKAIEIDPTDGPSKLYITRCKEYLKNPPGDDWDGVFIMTTK
jgi:hypothetical protein